MARVTKLDHLLTEQAVVPQVVAGGCRVVSMNFSTGTVKDERRTENYGAAGLTFPQSIVLAHSANVVRGIPYCCFSFGISIA